MVTLSVEATRWLRRYHSGPSEGPRLVCFPHAGGAATYFIPMSARVSDVAETLSVQYPGRQDRRSEVPETTIAALADRLAELLPSVSDRPTAFFGHSMGAVVAFEVIRRLEAMGATTPFILFASGRRAPSAVRELTQLYRSADDILLREIAGLGGTDPRVLADPELRAMILGPTRADYQAVEAYTCPPQATIDSAVTVLVGDADAAVTLDEAELWRRHTTGGFDLKVFPGGHFYLADHAPAVARLVSEALTSTAGRASGSNAVP